MGLRGTSLGPSPRQMAKQTRLVGWNRRISPPLVNLQAHKNQLLKDIVLPRAGCQVALSLNIHPSEAVERHIRLGKRISVIHMLASRFFPLFPLQYLINSWLDLVLNTQRKGPPQVASRPFPFTSNSASHTFHQKPFSTSFIECNFIQSGNY